MIFAFKQPLHSYFQIMLVFWVYFKIQGCYPASYRVEHSFQRGKPVSLNPDHTHFLLVDDGTQGQFGEMEVNFRGKLERVIAGKPNIQIQSEYSVCMCLWNGYYTLIEISWIWSPNFFQKPITRKIQFSYYRIFRAIFRMVPVYMFGSYRPLEN